MAEDLEELRKKKLEQLKSEQGRQAEDEKLKSALRSIMDDTAYNRMMNVKIANPAVFNMAAQGCMSVYSRLNRALGEKEVLMILRKVKGEEKQTSITFDRK